MKKEEKKNKDVKEELWKRDLRARISNYASFDIYKFIFICRGKFLLIVEAIALFEYIFRKSFLTFKNSDGIACHSEKSSREFKKKNYVINVCVSFTLFKNTLKC